MSAQSIHKQITAIMREVGAVGKNRENRAQGFMFRGIDDFYNAIQPLMAKHGVFSVPTVLEERREERTTKSGGISNYVILKIRYDFFADDGSSISAVVIGEAADSGDKASNKAMAVAHKYALLQVFAVPTLENHDPDSESHEFKPKEKLDESVPRGTSHQSGSPAAAKSGPPVCDCGHQMMVSFVNKGTWYCKSCKKTRAIPAA